LNATLSIAGVYLMRTLRSWKCTVPIGVILFLAFVKAHTLANLSGMNQWDVLWIYWNDIHMVTLLMIPSFLFLVSDLHVHDTVTGYVSMIYPRVRSRERLWLAQVLALLWIAIGYILGSTLVIFVVSGFFVPYQWTWSVPPAASQILFGNGLGVFPMLHSTALWGRSPWISCGWVWLLATLELWSLSVVTVTVTLRTRHHYLPVLLAFVIGAIGNSLLSEVPILLIPTSQLLVSYHLPYVIGYSLTGGFHVMAGQTTQTLGWSVSYLGFLLVASAFIGRWMMRRGDLARDKSQKG